MRYCAMRNAKIMQEKIFVPATEMNMKLLDVFLRSELCRDHVRKIYRIGYFLPVWLNLPDNSKKKFQQGVNEMSDRYFSKHTFEFLSALAVNNKREWFAEHQQEYEDFVRAPALDFISDISLEIPSISRHFLAQAKKSGGSLMRIYRDTRFGNDKTPYKTNIGIQFRHEVGKDIHAPGYYLHITPGECFVGVGLWRPDAEALFKIRTAIGEKSDAWVAARDEKTFKKYFTLEGDTLVNAPRGFAKDHVLLEDLKRKDFIALATLSESVVVSKQLRKLVVEEFRQAEGLMRFLCNALELQF
jgi:uncharacterized protein (TIGR02453 family)